MQCFYILCIQSYFCFQQQMSLFCTRYLCIPNMFIFGWDIYFAPNIDPSSLCRKSKHLKGPPLGATFLSSFGLFDVHIYISMSIYVSLPRYIHFTVHITCVLTPIKPSTRICPWVHDFKPILRWERQSVQVWFVKDWTNQWLLNALSIPVSFLETYSAE